VVDSVRAFEARAESTADASQLQASESDGIGYPASGLRLRFSSNDPSDEAFRALPEPTLVLGPVADGFVERRGDVPRSEVRLAVAPCTRFYTSALPSIGVQLSRHLQDEGFESVIVDPFEEEIDPATGRDLRGVGQLNLDLPVRADGPVKSGWSLGSDGPSAFRDRIAPFPRRRVRALQFGWSETERAYRREVQEFLAEALPSDWATLSAGGPGSDLQADFSRGFCARLAERGWLTQSWPREYGGADASPWRHAILGEELWGAGEPRGPQYMNVNWIGPAIMRYGTEAQKEEHLPAISRGEVLWCQGFSEPEAGSDLVALRTSARLEGDDYVVDGSKIWTSYANHASFCFLLVRSDPESRRHKGISVLLCPMDLPGIEVREIPSVVGERYFHEVFFDAVRVPASCRLGPEDEDWNVVRYALQFERVGAARYHRAARILDDLAEQARARGQLDEPRVQEKLGEARALCEAARVLTYRVIDQRAHGAPPSADSNVARIAGTTAEQAVAALALDLFGEEALEYGSYADTRFRWAMTAGVAVGATEIQLNLVAHGLLGLPRE